MPRLRASSMSLGAHKADWEELATLDPMWAILSAKDKRGNRWGEAEFFETGRAEIERLMREVGGLCSGRGKALDFGCGLGRLTRSLLAYYREAHGVDVSETMISRARRFKPQCQFHVNDSEDLSLFPDETFDLVYSNIVLQHLPCAGMIAKYLREFFRVATPGGLVVFQVPDRKSLRNVLNLKRSAYHLLKVLGVGSGVVFTRFKLHPMRMTAMPRSEVLAVVGEAGGEVIKQRPDTSARFGVFYGCRRLDVSHKQRVRIAAAGV